MELGAERNSSKDPIQQALQPKVSFPDNELAAGISGALFGGPVPKAISSGARFYLDHADALLKSVSAAKSKTFPGEGLLKESWGALSSLSEQAVKNGQNAARWWEEHHDIESGAGKHTEPKAKKSKENPAPADQPASSNPAGTAKQINKLADKIELEHPYAWELHTEHILHSYLTKGVQGVIPRGAEDVLTQEQFNDLVRYQELNQQLSALSDNHWQSLSEYADALKSQRQAYDALQPVLKQVDLEIERIRKIPRSTQLNATEKATLELDDLIKNGVQPSLDHWAQVLSDEGMLKFIAKQGLDEHVKELEEGLKTAQPLGDNLFPVLREHQLLSGKMQAITKELSIKLRHITPEEDNLLNYFHHLTGAMPDNEKFASAGSTLWKSLVAKTSNAVKLPGSVTAAFANFGKGMLAADVAQFVDDRLDNWIIGPGHNEVCNYTDPLAYGLGMLVPGGFVKKTAATIGGLATGHLLSWLVPAKPQSAWGELMQPTPLESWAVAAASVLPMRNPALATRMAYVGGAWAASKLANYWFHPATGLELNQRATVSWMSDLHQRTGSSMDGAINAFKNLGQNYPSVLQTYQQEWLSQPHHNYLSSLRGEAILLAAQGETMLAQGTVALTGHGHPPWWQQLNQDASQKYNYNFCGYNLDLGGDAYRSLLSAKIELERAQAYTQQLAAQNATVSGMAVDRMEVVGLKQEENRVDQDISLICGKHDLSAVFKQCQEYLNGSDQSYMLKMRNYLLSIIKTPPPGVDNQFMAKSYRDLTLMDLALSTAQSQNSATNMDYVLEAEKMFASAQKLDPGNADLEPLNQIGEEVGHSFSKGQPSTGLPE